MKKICSFALLLALIVSLCACGAGTVTMEDIYAANLSEALLANHESVYTPYLADGEAYGEGYLSKECVYDSALGVSNFWTEKAYYIHEDGLYKRLLLVSPHGLADIENYRTEKYTSLFLSPATVLEELQTVTEAGDRIIVTSVAGPDQMAQMKEDDEGLISCELEYTLDAERYELISSKGTYDYENGETRELALNFVYDGEVPEAVKTVLGYDNQTTDLRTITMIFNPGAKNEKTESVRIPKGQILLLGDLSEPTGSLALYDDAACTQPHAPSEDHTADMTVYLKWGE